MTKKEMVELIKRVCQDNHECYKRAQDKTKELKWANIWANCADVAEFIEIDLLRAIDAQPDEWKTAQAYTVSAKVLEVETGTIHCDVFKATETEKTAMSANEVLNIVNAVCDEEYGYYVNGSFDDFDSRQKCRTVTIRIKGKIARRCQERGLVLEKQEAVV